MVSALCFMGCHFDAQNVGIIVPQSNPKDPGPTNSASLNALQREFLAGLGRTACTQNAASNDPANDPCIPAAGPIHLLAPKIHGNWKSHPYFATPYRNPRFCTLMIVAVSTTYGAYYGRIRSHEV